MSINYVFKLDGCYSEISQTLPLYYQFVEKEGDNLTALSGWFRCRDFFNDAVANYHLNTNYSKYGFEIKFEKPIFKDKFYILVGIQHCNDVIEKRFTDNITYLKDVEITELDIPVKGIRSFYGKGLNKFYLVETYPKWFKSTIHISLFSLLVRLCLSDVHPPSKIEKGVMGLGSDSVPMMFTECMNLSTLLDVVDDIVGDDVPYCNSNCDYYDSSDIHNTTGIGTLFQKYRNEFRIVGHRKDYQETLKEHPIGNYIIRLHNILENKNA